MRRQGRRLGLGAAVDRQAEQVGLELEEGVGARHAAVDADIGERSSQVVGHGVDQVGDLEGDAFERGAGEVGDAGGAGEPEDGAAGGRLPVGRSQAGQGGDEDQLVVGVGFEGEGVDLGRGADGLQTVAEPLDGGTGDEDASFEGVLRGGSSRVAASVVSSPRCEGTTRPPVWASRKAPVPKVHFAWPGATQPWPIKEACWSPATPMIGMPSGRKSRPRVLPNSPALGRISGNICGGTPNNWQRSSAQLEATDVHEQRAGGVGRVGDEPLALVRCQIRKLSTVPAARSPASARGGTRRRGRESRPSWLPRSRGRSPGRCGRLISAWRCLRAAQASAVRRSCQTRAGAIGLPDAAVPDDCCFPLIGQTDGGDPGGGHARGIEGPGDLRADRSENGLGIVLDPAGARVTSAGLRADFVRPA